MSKVKVVKYQGKDVRRISSKDLAMVGLEAPRPLVWDKSNNWAIPVRDLDRQLVHYLIATREFVIGAYRA
jgi:hypothetical protein